MSLKFKKPIIAGAAAVTAALLIFGGTAAFATEAPTEDIVSSGIIDAPSEQGTNPASGDATTEQPVAQESAPIATKPPAVAAEPVEPATTVAPTPSETVTTDDTQSTPSEEQTVVVEAEAVVQEALTTAPVTDEKCVTLNKKTTSHTFSEITGQLSITVSGKVGTLVCNPGFVVITPFAYLKANSLWPQEAIGQDNPTRIYVDKVGSYSATPPFIKDCRQYDVGISFESWEKATPPKVLYGPGNPYEADMLHQHSTGPTTYHASSTYGCAGKPEVPGPKVTTSEWTVFKFVCGDTVAKSWQTVTTTYFTVVFVDGKFKLVEDTAKSTVVTNEKTRALTPEEIESCKPAVPEPTVVNGEWEAGKPDCVNEKVTVTRTVSKTTTTPVLVSGSTWTKQVETTVATETREESLSDAQLEACNPVVVPVDNHPASPPAAHVTHPQPSNLASTGADIAATLWGMFALFFAAAVAFIIDRLRRRKVVADQ
ncbi:MAG: hypothetical protein JWN28_28 [Candidatus Saccharibacteria bacterium]|nr:hypothetical protein [Candidatus Saccharibacteria bacterium]